LSQQRAFSVATFCLTESSGVLSTSEIDVLRTVLTANGRSYSNPIYNDDGTVNLSASRRVEFKFRLKDEEMIDEMVHILEQ
jgi:chemotaxis protein MotB